MIKRIIMIAGVLLAVLAIYGLVIRSANAAPLSSPTAIQAR